MAKETPEQRAVVGRVMHEFKEGKLDDGHGEVVRNPKQAIAIALNEAGASDRHSPAENRKRLAETRAKQRRASHGANANGSGVKPRRDSNESGADSA